MGDWFQSLVDVDATEGEAANLAGEIVAWLVAARFVASEPTDCVVGAETGRAPGPAYGAIVGAPEPRLLALRTNGMHARVGRTVFDSGQGGADSARCPSCGRVDRLCEEPGGDPTERWEAFGDAIGRWYDGGPGEAICIHCGRAAALNDWAWEPPWAFGCVGFTFWNWPRLRDAFVAEVGRRLGHRVVSVAGKL